MAQDSHTLHGVGMFRTFPICACWLMVSSFDKSVCKKKTGPPPKSAPAC